MSSNAEVPNTWNSGKQHRSLVIVSMFHPRAKKNSITCGCVLNNISAWIIMDQYTYFFWYTVQHSHDRMERKSRCWDPGMPSSSLKQAGSLIWDLIPSRCHLSNVPQGPTFAQKLGRSERRWINCTQLSWHMEVGYKQYDNMKIGLQ